MSKTQQLIINPEYEKLVPPLSNLEFMELTDSIGKNGLWVPIIINQNGIILDGHHRYKICKKYNIYPETQIKTFEDKLYEKEFVIQCNLKRRQLQLWSKVQIARVLLPIKEEIKELKQKEEGKKYGRGHKKESLREYSRKDKKRDPTSMAETASAVGMKEHTLRTALEVSEKWSDNDYIENNKKESKPHEIKRKKNKAKKKQQREEQLKQTQINIPKTIQLHNKPFQKVSIPNNSVSLIITDPPYAEEYLHLYEDLAKQASKVLRDGGSLLCYAGHYAIGRIINMMEKNGLKFHWPLVVLHSGPSASVFGYKVMVAYKPLLWFTKGKYEGEFVKDVIKSEYQGKELHEWAQSTIESDYYIKYMTIENEIVYDPFMGQGTFGISASKLKRQFIGCEIDKGHFENARRLLSIND